MELQEVEFRPRRRSERKSPDQVQQETSEQNANKDDANNPPLDESPEEQIIPSNQNYYVRDEEIVAADETPVESCPDFDIEISILQQLSEENELRMKKLGIIEDYPESDENVNNQPLNESHEEQIIPYVQNYEGEDVVVPEARTLAESCPDFDNQIGIFEEMYNESERVKTLRIVKDDPEIDVYLFPSLSCDAAPEAEIREMKEQVITYVTAPGEWPSPPPEESQSKQPNHDKPASRSHCNPSTCCFRKCWPLDRQESSAEAGRNIASTYLKGESGRTDIEQETEFGPEDRLLPGDDSSGPITMMDVLFAERPQGDLTADSETKEDELLKETKTKETAECQINYALKSRDIKRIEECVTPSILVKCTTNSLNKALEVSHKLHELARQHGPEEEEFLKLERNVEEFAVSLLDPLKTDEGQRNVFGAEIESFVDMAIDKRQKKFLAHPAVYNLLLEKWYGEFATFKNSQWTEVRWWTWLFLNLWTLLDAILFPVLFLVFFICRMITKVIKRKKGFKVGFVLYATGPESEKNAHPFMTETAKGTIESLGYKDGKFAVIAREYETVKWMGFQEGYPKDDFLKNVINAPTQPPWMHLPLGKSLDKAKELFEKEDDEDEKVLVILADYKATTEHNTWKSGADRVIAVPIGPFAKRQQLEVLAGEDGIIVSHGLENPKELGKNIAEKIQGKDMFKWYKLYFLTPYFIYLRDTVSFLALLILHYAVCLAPSTISLSGVEITIIIFFIGRLMMEIKQFVDARETKTDSDESNGHALWRNILLYFRDRWNVLDFITILTFFVIFPLRLVTLRSSSITQNRTLVIANYMYGLNTMFLTLRVLGSILESTRRVGVMQIALFKIIGYVTIIFWQFLAALLAFSMAITKIFIADRSYVVSREKDNERLCQDAGVSCWLDTFRHLMWSLLGIADSDKFGSTDKASINLVWALYAMFLVMAVIMLVNMLIAVLSNVYQGVEDNSLPEWCFKRAITHRTYNNYHPIPVPLNVVTILCMALYGLVRTEGNTEGNSDQRIQDRRKNAIDKLMLILEGEYFATYGHSFPLTDERKLDQVMEELAGNRKITNQLSRRVFFNENSLGVEGWARDGIRIDGNTLTYSAPDDCNKCEKEEPKPHHSAQYLVPLDENSSEFEVLIQESGERRLLSVGVVLGSDRVSFHNIIPGWMKDSVGYHIDDGRIFYENHRIHGQELKDAMAHRGDIITCKVHFELLKNESSEVPVSFSLNGKEVGRECVKKNSTGQLYPCIGMGYEGISVQFTMGKFNNIIPKAVMRNREMSDVVVTAELKDEGERDGIEESQEMIEKPQLEIDNNSDKSQADFEELLQRVHVMEGMLRQIMGDVTIIKLRESKLASNDG